MKSGRKKLSEHEKRKHQINCRVTDAELKKINSGKPPGVTPGEWMRKKALDRKLPRTIPELNREAWADLARALGNLNQITKHLNQGNGNLSVAIAQVEQLGTQIQKLRDQLLREVE